MKTVQTCKTASRQDPAPDYRSWVSEAQATASLAPSGTKRGYAAQVHPASLRCHRNLEWIEKDPFRYSAARRSCESSEWDSLIESFSIWEGSIGWIVNTTIDFIYAINRTGQRMASALSHLWLYGCAPGCDSIIKLVLAMDFDSKSAHLHYLIAELCLRLMNCRCQRSELMLTDQHISRLLIQALKRRFKVAGLLFEL